jgi:hypothetical protein
MSAAARMRREPWDDFPHATDAHGGTHDTQGTLEVCDATIRTAVLIHP